MKSIASVALLVMSGSFSAALRADDAKVVFPGKTWETRRPAEVGLAVDQLKEFSQYVGGRGCVVRHGYLVYSWGDIGRRADVASACKPFYSHLLFKALEDGKIASLDEKVVRWEPRLNTINKELASKDAGITWRHFANQTSCYQLAETPGTAFAYNDWQMAFWDTLFLKVYGATYDNVDKQVFRRLLMDRLQCQDEPTMLAFSAKDRAGRVGISVRDFARFGLLYLHQGNWNGEQLIRKTFAQMAVTSPLPNSVPRAGMELVEMIPKQRSIGSERMPDNQTDHRGSYSWLWWINGIDRNGARRWPAAPTDTFGAFGHGGPRSMWVMPGLDIVVSYDGANLHDRSYGDESGTNQAMKRLVAACIAK